MSSLARLLSYSFVLAVSLVEVVRGTVFVLVEDAILH